MVKGVYEYTYPDGVKARWVREPDGYVVYNRDDRWMFRLSKNTWRELTSALSCDPLPTESIPLVGELVGWRCWRMSAGDLWSLVRQHVWLPHELEQGHVGEDVGGIYAFKSKSRAVSEAAGLDDAEYPIVVGSVFLWGDAIEAADGWRAEFAKVRSIDSITISDAAVKSCGIHRDPIITQSPRLWGLWNKTAVIQQEPIEPDTDVMLSDLRRKYLGNE